jgi:hypothetical protein
MTADAFVSFLIVNKNGEADLAIKEKTRKRLE